METVIAAALIALATVIAAALQRGTRRRVDDLTEQVATNGSKQTLGQLVEQTWFIQKEMQKDFEREHEEALAHRADALAHHQQNQGETT